jgi:predicted nucleic acid-binding protein
VGRIILLDAGPLGLATGQPRKPQVIHFDIWVTTLELTGVDVFVPEIADYEVRRELMRIGATAGLRRLDALQSRYTYLPITSGAMRRAAEFWADVRRRGVPTAAPDALDADCILAGQAVSITATGNPVTIATTNITHLSRFPSVDAQDWTTIT